MHLYFDIQEFDQQLIRAISYTYYNGADIGECISTASRIKDGDFDNWHQEWFETGERVSLSAETSHQLGHDISAHEAYLRASNYYRASLFFLYGAPVDPRLPKVYEKHVEAFDKAIKLFATPVTKVSIPFENTQLPGLFLQGRRFTKPEAHHHSPQWI